MTQPREEELVTNYDACKTWCKEHYEIPSEEYNECIEECEEFFGDDEEMDEWGDEW